MVVTDAASDAGAAAAGDGGRRLKAYVHLGYGTDPDNYLRRYEQGKLPDRSPYGFHHAESMGFDVTYSSDRLSPLAWRISQVCRRLFRLDPLHGFANRRRMAEADVIWTMGEWDAMMARAMMALGIVPRRPIIGTAIWVVHQWDGFGPALKMLYRALLKRVDLVALHTQACLAECRRKLPEVNSELMYFGIASETFLGTPEREEGERIRIVAAGNDMTRDWDVLLRAFGNDPSVDLVIINQQLGDDLLARYSNLTIPRKPTMQEFRALYRGATYIAVPLHENIYSGITVALEAMAIGVPVIATRTGGIPTYMAEDEALLVAPGDAEAWRTAIRSQTREERRAMAERAHDRFRRDDYSTIGLMRQFARSTRALLARTTY